MSNRTPISPLSILVLYGKLRRAGTNRDSACEKLRGLIHPLSPADRKEFTKAIDDWEAKQSKKLATGSSPVVPEQEAPAPVPDSGFLVGMSEYDRLSAERGSSAIRPLHGAVVCPTCGQQTDMNADICAHCGNLLEEFVALANRSDTTGQTWFGPDSKLIFAINGADDLLDLPVRGVLTLGRHTSASAQVNVDLTDYRAEQFGVSRVHASIARQGARLTLTDLHSTNHTYLNGKQLADDEVCTLTSGDEIYLAELGLTVIFKADTEPQAC